VFADALRSPRRVDLALSLTGRPRPSSTSSTFSGEDMAFLRWLFEQQGLDTGHYRLETLQRRLSPCLRALRVGSSNEARRLLEQQPRLAPIAMSTLLIGITGFFRDPAVFATLRDSVLPALAAGRPAVRVWSAGCSDGAELFSIAILLAESGLLAGADLLGTDCRPDAIRRAREGLFDDLALKHLPPDLRARYFIREQERWRLAEPLVAAARWRTGNLLAVPEPGVWDMILCRNLAIYMQSDAIAALWRTLEPRLRPGGILVVGKAERPTEARGFSTIAPCVYRRERV
jgi:chemotaxis methyl-accepting protein methylase